MGGEELAGAMEVEEVGMEVEEAGMEAGGRQAGMGTWVVPATVEGAEGSGPVQALPAALPVVRRVRAGCVLREKGQRTRRATSCQSVSERLLR